MLDTFLIENRNEILKYCEAKSRAAREGLPSSSKLKRGLPIFFTQLIEVLHKNAKPKKVDMSPKIHKTRHTNVERLKLSRQAQRKMKGDRVIITKTAAVHGAELLRLGYTISQVVHAYGALCQSITEIAHEKRIKISSIDFQSFNLCLDIAIAGAVTAYEINNNKSLKKAEI